MSASADTPLFLRPDEVAELTGYKVISRQIDWLRAKGWRFELNAIRRPIIARSYAEKMLGCGAEYGASTRPNFAALGTA